MDIYRINHMDTGILEMRVSQAQVDAVRPAGLVAVSPSGLTAVRVWKDRNITFSMGPDWQGKIFHITVEGHVKGKVLEMITTYGKTP